MRFAITGVTGFIGMHLANHLVSNGHEVVYSCDTTTPIYGGNVSELRQFKLKKLPINFEVCDLCKTDPDSLAKKIDKADVVIHLAANAGVRQSALTPFAYSKSNIDAFSVVLEAVRIANTQLFMFASSSSVYGNFDNHTEQREELATGLNLASYYAATKWANEVMAKTYAENFNLRIAALRFFTVYGSYGRPDMAYWTFAQKILTKSIIELYGDDGGSRSFSHVSNIVDLISQLSESKSLDEFLSTPDNNFVALNLGNPKNEPTLALIKNLSYLLNSTANIKRIERPKFDVDYTQASMEKTLSFVGEIKFLNIEDGLPEFSSWYIDNFNHLLK
jgi:UDP-glucuronate 4-epimerase